MSENEFTLGKILKELKRIADALEAKKERKPVKQHFDKKGPYKISTKPCKQCGGLISWDLYPDRKGPLHVDSEGFPIDNGDCPNYSPEE